MAKKLPTTTAPTPKSRFHSKMWTPSDGPTWNMTHAPNHRTRAMPTAPSVRRGGVLPVERPRIDP